MTHPACEGKDRFKCPCWERGAREEAEARRIRPAAREVTEYIRAIGDADPAMSTEEIARNVMDVFGQPAPAAPLDRQTHQAVK